MKIANYNDMMAYLTQPDIDILPRPKPQELLDLQEQNRKDRLRETMETLDPVLMDESKEFIERENFSRGSFAETIKEAEKAVAEFKKKNNRLPYPGELPELLGKSRTQTYRIVQASKKKLTTPSPMEAREGVMKKNIAEESKSIKKGMDIIKEDYKKFKKTALPNQPYVVGSNLVSFRDVNGNKITLSGSPKTRNKIIDNLIEEGLDIKRIETQGSTTGGENITGGLSKEERNYFKKNYKNKTLGEMTRKFLPEGTGTNTNIYNRKVRSFMEYKDGLLNQGIIKDQDLMKPPVFEPGQSAKEYTARRYDALDELGVKYQEEEFSKIKREIADEIYGEQAFVTDKRGNTRVRIDQGHRGGYEQFKKLKANYPIASVGPDLDDVNRKNIKLVESKLEPFYKKQVSLFNKAKKNLTPELRKSIDENNREIAQLVAKAQYDDPKIKGRIIGVQVDPFTLKVGTTPIDYTKALDLGTLDDAVKIGTGREGKINKEIIKQNYKALLLKEGAEQGFLKKGITIPTAEDNKNIAKQLSNLGFKCSAAEGGACDNPMAYLDSIKEQEMRIKAKAPGSEKALRAVKAGKAIFKEVLGPAALGFELAAAVPITYLGYKAGLPPQRILADATYGLLGQTEKRRVLDEAVKAGIDTTDIKRMQDFYDKAEKFKSTAIMEETQMSPDDAMQYPDQYAKAEEDFFETIGKFEGDEERFLKAQSDLADIQQNIAQQNIKAAQERADFLKQGMFNFSEIDDALAYMANGGRIGFADGPEDPSKRTFLKIMGGLASLPILGKFFKGAKTAKVVKLANTTTTMPDWFPAFVDKALAQGVKKKVDADLMEVEIPDLPGVKMEVSDAGPIRVEGVNAYDEPYVIEYTPPGYTVVDETTGQAVPTPGDFKASDTQYYRTGNPEEMDYDVDFTSVKDVEDILGGNSTELEGFAKGTKETKLTRGQKAVDEADSRLDVDEGPDIDLSDYED
jgi:hypothetical protein